MSNQTDDKSNWVWNHLQKLEPLLRVNIDRRIGPQLVSEVDIDDVFQEVFLLARARHDRFRQRFDGEPKQRDVFTWLYRLMGNVFSEIWRRLNTDKRDVKLKYQPPDSIPFDFVGGGQTPLSEADKQVRAGVLRAAMDQLDEQDSVIIELVEFDGLPYEKIASMFGIKPNSVSKRFCRAMDRLREVLSKTNDTEFQNL